MLKFIVKNQVIHRADTFRVVSNSENYLKAKFIFETNDWSEMDSITAIFEGMDGKAYGVILDETNECVVPWETLISDGEMCASLIGLKADSKITTNRSTVLIESSGSMSATSVDKPSTLNIVEQIIGQLNIHQYSENKKLIGRWVNDLPIYEITFIDKNILLVDGKMVAKSNIISESDLTMLDVKCIAKLHQTGKSRIPKIDIIDTDRNEIDVRCTLNYVEPDTSADFFTTIQYIEGDII